jgi:hypothetical protein
MRHDNTIKAPWGGILKPNGPVYKVNSLIHFNSGNRAIAYVILKENCKGNIYSMSITYIEQDKCSFPYAESGCTYGLAWKYHLNNTTSVNLPNYLKNDNPIVCSLITLST